jgi:L-alanine-DL-glutamate epimerase-like enolase superfamily enzyme
MSDENNHVQHMATTADGRITGIAAWTCSFALPRPVILSHGPIRSREYVIVRVTTSDGAEGVAYALTRGAPLAELIRGLLTPLLLGQDALSPAMIRDRIEHQLVLLGTDGLVERALSLIDICLWDIKARVAGLPLWRLLGGRQTTLPALLVDWYPTGREEIPELVDEFLARAEDGYRAFKIHCTSNPEWLALLLREIRAKLGTSSDLVLDAAMGWRDPIEAICNIRFWEDYFPTWIEDPFRAERVEWIRRVRHSVRTPIGAGDEVPSPLTIRQLVTSEAVDVLRLDATNQGGVSGFLSLSSHAASQGCRVSAHVYPEIHQHLAFSCPGIDSVEMFSPGTPFDCSEQFIDQESLVRPVAGHVHAPKRDGLGIAIDWDTVKTHAIG